jgi:CYTH domain-containing protein
MVEGYSGIDENAGFGEFEFERRFWVRDFPAQFQDSPALIVQSYFLAEDGYAIRVRCQATNLVADFDEMKNGAELLRKYREQMDFAAITVKGPAAGGTRYESERVIDPGVGVELVLRGKNLVTKVRYSVWLGQDGWVVDVFGGENSPLIIAECERSSPVTDLQIPSFCFTEITDDHRFANDSLAHHPYAGWRQEYEAELAKTGAAYRSDFGANS